jgi:pSer/pThr/pTyr-binding forkhead associated (FHA) protein
MEKSPNVTPTRLLSSAELQELIAAERRAAPFLVYRDGDGRQQIRPLQRGPRRLTIGRISEADLALPWDEQVSRMHAELEAIGPEWAAVDDGLSTNGTFVNGRRIVGRRRLIDGDTILVGATSVTFRHPGQEPLAKTVAAGLPVIETVSPTQRRVLVALCRPLKDSDGFSPPATNQQIADEVSLSVEAVKTHLRAMYRGFKLGSLAQNQKRARLAEIALQTGIVSARDL